MSYSIDIVVLIKKMLPPILRTSKRMAWIVVLMKGLMGVHGKFLTYTDKTWDDVKYTGQVFVLEKLLEKRFGVGLIISIPVINTDMVIGSENDWNSSVGVGADFDSKIGTSFIGSVQNDFTVNVPVALVVNQIELRAVVDKYKMFGTVYNVVTI